MSNQLSYLSRWMNEAEIRLCVSMLAGWRARGPASVLGRLHASSAVLAKAVANAQMTFLALGSFRLEATRAPGLVERARKANDRVLALLGPHVSDPALLARAEEIFGSRKIAIEEGPSLIESGAAGVMAREKKLERLRKRRLSKAPSKELKAEIEDAIMAALSDPERFFLSPRHRASLESFLRQVFVADELVEASLAQMLAPLIETLARAKAANRKWVEWIEQAGKAKFDPEEFAKHFQHQRNYVKGCLGELWFQLAAHTEDVRGLLHQRVVERARRLSRPGVEFTPDSHIGPLFDASGRQIFDGIYFVGRPAEAAGGRYLEIFLDSVIEVKTGTRADNVLQQRLDQLRELGVGASGLEVRSADGRIFKIMPSPDMEDPIRVFVQPQRPNDVFLDTLSRGGIDTIYVPTLPTAEQFGEVADFFLLAMLHRL